MTRTARVAAQAKINIGLRILAREEGGYHSLETVFARIDLADDVLVRAGVGGRTLDCTGVAPAPMEENLAWRAAVAYSEAAGWPSGFAIELEKRIPAGGGLGGGSADAGAVLRALDAMAPDPLGEGRLLEVAGRLGADVPFLTMDHPFALAWGRGERMLMLPVPEPRGVELVVFPFGVATGPAFGWLAEERAAGAFPERRRPLAHRLSDLGSWEGLADTAVNDLEGVVAAHHPEIGGTLAAARAALGRRAIVEMSGSGSTVFAIGAGESLVGADWLAPGARVLSTRTSGLVVGVALMD